jgi:RND superfamily putative drug exporter
VLLWIVFVSAAVGAGSAISTVPATQADSRVGQSGRADEIITETNLDGAPQENVLVTSPDGEQLDPVAVGQIAGEVSTAMAPLDGVTAVGDPVLSRDMRAALIAITLQETDGNSLPDVAPLEAATSQVQQAHPTLRIEQAGAASIEGGIAEQTEGEFKSAEAISLPITFVLMLMAFGALIAAGIPVLLALSSVVATIGIYAPVSHLVPSSPVVSSTILLIGMAVGVDYSLFYLKRAREERARGHGPIDAVEIAAATSGHAVVVSGLAVMVSMAGLYVIGNVIFNGLATGAILVVAIAVLGSITVLPALLVKLGKWVDRPRVPLLWRLNNRIGHGGISRRLLGPVLRHPTAAVVVSAVVVVGLTAPALGMKIDSENADTWPQEVPQVQTLHRLQQAFPSVGATMQVVVKSEAPVGSGAEAPSDVVAALNALADEAIATGDFAESAREVRTSDDGTAAMLTLASADVEDSSEGTRLVQRMREELAPRYLDELTGAEWAVGGMMGWGADGAKNLRDALPWVVGAVLLLTMVMMGITFRSVPIALLTTALNLASVGIAFGVLTLVFQRGLGERLLDFSSTGFVIEWVPLFVFVVLVGLSMDYHVFVLSRIREGIQHGLSPRHAVESGLTQTAGVVTSAAAVMVSVFAIFATFGMLAMKMMGVGLSVAVLVDATLIRIVMLPALLTLLGTWAWGRTDREVAPVAPKLEPEPVPAYTRAALNEVTVMSGTKHHDSIEPGLRAVTPTRTE